MHGKTMILPDTADHFHIAGTEPISTYLDNEAKGAAVSSIPIKEGTYSSAHHTNDFEWDGWDTSDL